MAATVRYVMEGGVEEEATWADGVVWFEEACYTHEGSGECWCHLEGDDKENWEERVGEEVEEH